MKTLIISLKMFLFFTILTGILYTLLITGIAQVVFPVKANGSLVSKNNVVIGSELIGQQFDSPRYFTSRPSAVSYNTLPSGGSNYGWTSASLKNLVEQRRQQFILSNQLDPDTDVPSEMLFASASGLDPHISKQSALLQADRISRVRNFNSIQKKEMLDLIDERVNVFLLNLKIDSIK